MCLAVAAILLAMIQVLSPSLTPEAAAADVPSPVLGGMCDDVDCGRGLCQTSANSTFGFECKCDHGWTQLQFLDHVPFLPCVIPKCAFDYACYNDSMAHAPTTFPEATDLSLLDPCRWSFCGSGTCIRASSFRHHCECREGFSNLLNLSNLPCFRDCVVMADCPTLGFTLSNGSSPSSSPNFPETSNRASPTQRKFLWLYIITICVVMVQTTQKYEV